jgi:hypothetical protein
MKEGRDRGRQEGKEGREERKEGRKESRKEISDMLLLSIMLQCSGGNKLSFLIWLNLGLYVL